MFDQFDTSKPSRMVVAAFDLDTALEQHRFGCNVAPGSEIVAASIFKDRLECYIRLQEDELPAEISDDPPAPVSTRMERLSLRLVRRGGAVPVDLKYVATLFDGPPAEGHVYFLFRDMKS